YNLLAPEAWQEFIKITQMFPLGQRPGHVSQFSTPQEFEKFIVEAGFADAQVDATNPQLVVGVGHKHEERGWKRPQSALGPEYYAWLKRKEEEPPDQGVLKVVDGKAILPYDEWLSINEHVQAKDHYIEELER